MTPRAMRADLFKALHHGELGGHQGVNKTLAQLKTRYYWPRMREDVQTWCARGHTCGETKPMMIRKKSALRQTQVGAPFEKTAIDLMGPFAKSDKNNVYVVVIQDYFTKWVVAEGIGFTERHFLPGTGVILDVYGHVHLAPIKHPVRGYPCALMWSRTVRAC